MSSERFPVRRALNILSSGMFKMETRSEISPDKFNEPSGPISCPTSPNKPVRDTPSRSKYYYALKYIWII